MRRKPRVGVYVCHCGSNIAGYVDIPQLLEKLKTMPDVVVVTDQKYMCSDQGQVEIQDALRKGFIDRVIVASCSPILHERTLEGVLLKRDSTPISISRLTSGRTAHGSPRTSKRRHKRPMKS